MAGWLEEISRELRGHEDDKGLKQRTSNDRPSPGSSCTRFKSDLGKRVVPARIPVISWARADRQSESELNNEPTPSVEDISC